MNRHFSHAVLTGLLLVAFHAQAGSAWGQGASPAWDRQAAVNLLDARAAEQGQGTFGLQKDGTRCITCHTAVPYLLARPELRGATKAEGSVQRMLEDIRKRVQNWSNVVPMYTFNDTIKKQSLGSEAIINALVLVLDDARKEKEAVLSPVTRQAFKNLWALQRRDGDSKGAWDWMDFKLQPWESQGAQYYGAALAALAVGSAPGAYAASPEIQDNLTLLRAYLKSNYAAQPLHHRIFLLWASTRLDGLLAPAERKDLIAALFKLQKEDGGWSLTDLGNWKRLPNQGELDRSSDGYATGLVVYVLQQSGLSADEPALKKGLGWLAQNQDRAAGRWSATSQNKNRAPGSTAYYFMSDAATAYAVLALTRAEWRDVKLHKD